MTSANVKSVGIQGNDGNPDCRMSIDLRITMDCRTINRQVQYPRETDPVKTMKETQNQVHFLRIAHYINMSRYNIWILMAVKLASFR